MHNMQPLADAGRISAGEMAGDLFAARMRSMTLLIVALAGAMLVLIAHGPLYFVLGGRAYLPLHTAMEIFAVVVSGKVFGIGWHSFDGRVPPAIIVLSSAFLAVGLLDIGHLLSFPGMPALVTASSVAKGIDFWLAARATGAAALLAAALVSWQPAPTARLRMQALGATVCGIALTFWAILFHPDALPATFMPGQGLTAFKIVFEYALVGAYLLAAVMLLRRARVTRTEKAASLFTSACIMALSELCFTLYSDATDVFNVLGHLYKVIAYFYLYRAIFIEGVQEPFRRLAASQASLARSESRFRRLMEFAPEAILLIDRAGRIVMMNACAERMFGYARETLVGMPAERVMPAEADGGQPLSAGHGKADAPVTFEAFCRRPDGVLFPVEISLGHLEAEEALAIAIVRDISERRHFETVLLDQVTHDALTGLPNRVLINERLREAAECARSAGRMLGVLFLDIDHFKRVNDTFGHAFGDEVLREAVARLRRCLRGDDVLARQGGDEFIILQQDAVAPDVTAARAESLLAGMRKPFLISGREVFLSASIGISLFPLDGITAEELLHGAEIAMNSAKQWSRNCYRFHTVEMDHAIRERLELEEHLRHAVEKGQLLLNYQPRVSVASGTMVAMEALVRWHHPEWGLISPVRFIPIAEESGLIEQIGLWVLRTACAQVKAWQQQGLRPGRVSVNLSARQFQQAGLAASVHAILAETGLSPASLELEITESTVMKDTASAIRTLRSLKRLGISLSIDDFGTGYSSLSYLKLFPIDVLKIDRSFVKDVIVDPDGAAITRAIVTLAHSLDLTAVAEGVETAAQAAFLRECRCDEIQGFHFSRPIAADAMAAMLREQPVMSFSHGSETFHGDACDE